MQNSFFVFSICLTVLITISFSCKKEQPVTVEELKPTTPYNLEYPSYFPPPLLSQENPLTVEGILLGRKLYYDQLLSQGGPQNGLSCSSCHFQSFGFTTPSKPFPEFGIVMPHINMAWNTNFLWNGNVSGSLEDIMKFEVEEFFVTDLQLFNANEDYKKLVKQVFKKDEITHKELSYALAQFFRTLISGNSKFDKWLRKEVQLSPSEMNGFNIFNTERGDCFHCHALPLFNDDSFHNTGLEATFIGNNLGRYAVTADVNDLGKFKTPTLRNVALRGKYMHDGRFTTLEEVIQHYNFDVKLSPTLDPIMTKPGKEYGLELSTFEVADLVAFLHTLTDSTFINNPDLGKP